MRDFGVLISVTLFAAYRERKEFARLWREMKGGE